jgi:hypothetical protein
MMTEPFTQAEYEAAVAEIVRERNEALEALRGLLKVADAYCNPNVLGFHALHVEEPRMRARAILARYTPQEEDA